MRSVRSQWLARTVAATRRRPHTQALYVIEMKRYCVLFSLLLLPSIVLSGQSNYLIGKWISDKEETIKYNKERANWTDKQLEIFNEILGKLEITFTESHTEWQLDEITEKEEYEIVEVKNNSITIRTKSTIVDRTYYKVGEKIYLEPTSSKTLIREYFKKVE